jgi:hypothetical protein
MNYKHGFALLANARAFLESATEYVGRNNVDEKRFAVLHLVTALELLLKAKLAMSDPRLLMSRGKAVTDDAFERGDFHSVGMERAIELMTDAGLLQLSDRQLRQLATLRGMRNRVTHFVDAASAVETRAALGAGLHLFIEIHNAEFSDDDVYRAKPMREVTEELSRCDEFVKARLEHLSASLQSAVRPRTHWFSECSNCLQDATVIIGENVESLFCGTTSTIRDHAECISEDSNVESCPECGRASVACRRWRAGELTYECICCGHFQGGEIQERDASG